MANPQNLKANQRLVVPPSTRLADALPETHINAAFMSELGATSMVVKYIRAEWLDVVDPNSGAKRRIAGMYCTNPKTGEQLPPFYFSALEDKAKLRSLGIQSFSDLDGMYLQLEVRPLRNKQVVRIADCKRGKSANAEPVPPTPPVMPLGDGVELDAPPAEQVSVVGGFGLVPNGASPSTVVAGTRPQLPYRR